VKPGAQTQRQVQKDVQDLVQEQVQEKALVARAAAGDTRAFAELVLAHQGYLRKLLGRVCRGD
jgi:hypothetical protein